MRENTDRASRQKETSEKGRQICRVSQTVIATAPPPDGAGQGMTADPWFGKVTRLHRSQGDAEALKGGGGRDCLVLWTF